MEYFSTTGGNNVACVVANTVLEIIDEEKLQVCVVCLVNPVCVVNCLQDKAQSVGQYLMAELRCALRVTTTYNRAMSQ
jgi:4-aminobutyrate aminotransferase-like enzyme